MSDRGRSRPGIIAAGGVVTAALIAGGGLVAVNGREGRTTTVGTRTHREHRRRRRRLGADRAGVRLPVRRRLGVQLAGARGEPEEGRVVLPGACFSAETWADRGVCDTAVDDVVPTEDGVFDFADARNPFADYSVVYVPCSIGDVFLGDATTEDASGLTIQHKGYVNGTAVLHHLAATFPDVTDVVVTGESTGSVAAPLYAGARSLVTHRRQRDPDRDLGREWSATP